MTMLKFPLYNSNYIFWLKQQDLTKVLILQGLDCCPVIQWSNYYSIYEYFYMELEEDEVALKAALRQYFVYALAQTCI